MKSFFGYFHDFARLSIDTLIYAESFFHHKLPFSKKRILIMRKDGLGDCIIFYPTLHAYREYYNDAEITLIFPTYFESLAPILGKDLVDRVIWFDHKKFGSSFLYRRKFLLDLKRDNYDVFIYPVYSRETIGFFMMQMTGARERIGFEGDISEHGKRSERRGTLAFTKLIRPPQGMDLEIDRDANFVEQITSNEVHIFFPSIDIDILPRKNAEDIISKYKLRDKKYVVVFPGAGASYRIWPTDRFAQIVNYILSQNISVIICGSNNEIDLVQRITLSTKEQSAFKESQTNNLIDLSGKTDLATLAHILSGSQFYFGSDTGILHLAVAVKIPVVAIVGSGGLNRFFPYGDPHINRAVCDKSQKYLTGRWVDVQTLKPGEIHPSIVNITTDQVKLEIDQLLKYLHDNNQN
ncbi:MAG: glycosyltransferase family 9 protein [Candidatus Taylorbacteria bacterium]